MCSKGIFSYQTWVHAVAGSAGSVIAMATFYPLDTARFRLQVEDVDNAEKPKNTMETLMELIKSEGFWTLYRGITPVLQSLSASNFIYFYTFHGLKQMLSYSATNDLLVGIAAGAINVIVTTPLWVVNSRLKMNGLNSYMFQYSGLLDGIAHIARYEGIKELWAGVLPSLVLVTNPAIQFMVYESVKRKVHEVSKENPAIVYFLIGAFAKAVATVATYPIQLVQTKMRHGLKHNLHISPQIGAIELMVHILKRHGISGLFRGLEAKLIQTVLTAALMFATYEKIVLFVTSVLLKRQNLQ